MEVLTRAKINLSLRVLGKRPDGFHELDTLMVEVSLSDRLQFEPGGVGTRLSCSRPDLQCEDNLVLKAVRALEAETGRRFDLAVHLDKAIPSGAGLGGGSSDAAATLRAVNELFALGLSQERLLHLAASLGCDVPFFFIGQSCRCRGRGEILEPVAGLPSLPVALFKLPLEIPTPWAYQHWAASMEVPGLPYAPQTCAAGRLINDLERPVFDKFLILGLMKSWLLAQEEVEAALLSGSGSAVFAVLREARLGQPLLAKARQRYGEQLWCHLGQANP